MVMRGQKRKGVRYFGPYGHAYAIRETLDLLLRTFPIRTCSDNKFAHHQRLGRPCLLFHIEKCSGPCVKEIEKPDYDQLVKELGDFLDGDTQPVVKRLEQQMGHAASELEFERAARLRDRLAAVRKVIERQQMVTEKPEDIDVIGLVEDELEAAVQVFYVRRGRVSSGARASSSTRSKTSPGRSWWPTCSSACTSSRRSASQGGARPRGARRPRVLRGVAVRAAGIARRRAGAAAGRQAVAAGHRHPQRSRGVHPPPAQAVGRPQQPGPRPHRAAGRAWACRWRRCASSAST